MFAVERVYWRIFRELKYLVSLKDMQQRANPKMSVLWQVYCGDEKMQLAGRSDRELGISSGLKWCWEPEYFHNIIAELKIYLDYGRDDCEKTN